MERLKMLFKTEAQNTAQRQPVKPRPLRTVSGVPGGNFLIHKFRWNADLRRM